MFNSTIKEVGPLEMMEIIEKRTPIGKYYRYHFGINKYVACDNSTGDAWVEEFETRHEAIDWLMGSGK